MPGVELRHGWDIARISEMASLVNGYPFASELFTPDGEVPLVRIRDITAADFETFVPRDAVPHTAWIQNDDLVIGMDGDFNAAIWRRKPAALNQRVCLLRPRPGNDIRFIAYLLPEMLKVVNDLTYATTVKHLSSGDVTSQHVARPNFEWQRQIADYLDAHTAKIDTLIGKQERLIEALAERRQAVISHAVTKGLDPNAVMKDSGVEWMGSIPSSWTVSRVRYIARILGGYSPEQVEPREMGPFPYFKVSDLNQADGNYSVASAAEYMDQRALTAPTGTILFPKRGAAIFTNKVTISAVRAAIDTNLMGLLVNDLLVNPLFLLHWLKSRTLNELADTSTLPQINNKHIYPLQIGLPSLEAQREITEHIDRETTQIDSLAAKAREMIDVLKERRQALISAAVTGKIDVRGLA